MLTPSHAVNNYASKIARDDDTFGPAMEQISIYPLLFRFLFGGKPKTVLQQLGGGFLIELEKIISQ